jgi:hypothetical protein
MDEADGNGNSERGACGSKIGERHTDHRRMG